MEQILFLVLVAVVGLIRWIAQAAENKRNAEEAKRADPLAPNAPIPRAPAQTEEERIRRFMEALGVPTTSEPPAKTPPRRVVPKTTPKKIRPVDPFPIPRAGTPLPPVMVAPPPLPPVVPPPQPQALPTRATTVLARPEVPALTTQDFEVESIDEVEIASTTSVVRPAPAERGWAGRLATAEGLRDAIILREIFGPPRSMQPLGAIQSQCLASATALRT